MRDPSKKFYVCYGCAKNRGHGDGHSMDGCPSGIPSQTGFGNGCLLGLIFMPFCLAKSFLTNLF